ncbi:putative chorismate pyruvate-lyase [Thiosulfatimonas sediminis]|uniref:Probable chorismate pyruvate-lyase n=1 Tax=Thiosulfatimonas sediminis TaxID=2675054 RepID=A0A6F8PY93_9GAMM|nr:chorismate lyase [Thiosulfatimonas sediminis]BBP47091.1 putative chorismate pyruvate-lyase [Thiosulfatimonas sediminis]
MSIERLAKIKALLQQKTPSKTLRPQFWKPVGLLSRITPVGALHAWLKTPKSLTAKLKKRCPELHVKILSETFEIPLLSETQRLGLAADETVWVRCVVLQCGSDNWVYARTVIPAIGPDNPWQELQQLGNKPLGEVLFEMPNVQRSEFEFSKDTLDYWPYLAAHLNNAQQNKLASFARRSIFTENDAQLLLTEVFLPDLTTPKA